MKFSSIAGRFFRRGLLTVCGLLFAARTVCSAAPSPAQTKATSVLIEEIQALLESGSYQAAIDDLDEILVRLDSLTDADSLAARSACLYQLGFCQLKAGDFSGAAGSFKKFIEGYPQHELIPAARFMVLEAFAREHNLLQMDLWLKNLRSSGAFNELTRFLSDEKNADFRRNTVLTLTAGYAEQGSLENLRVFLPFCDETVLVDIGLNKSLMSGGDQAFNKKDYALALVLYRMVRLKDEMLPVYNRQIAELEAELAKPPPWVALTERDRQQAERLAEQDRLAGLKQTVQYLNESGYDLDLQLRIAQTYDAMERHGDSLAVYQDMYIRFPEHRLAEQCRASAFQALIALDEQEAAIAAGRDYLTRYPHGRFEDEVTASLMQLHLSRGELAASGELGRGALSAQPDRRLADQITYLLGMTELQQQNWPEALVFFATVKNRWPQSVYVQDADYWSGMCYLFNEQFNEAIAVFKSYLNNPAYVPARFSADATYRLGVARYGAEAYAEAEGTLKEFLVLYPDNPLVSEAYSLLGDLRGADGDLDTALTMYRSAIEKAVDGEQDSYAVFQAARVYELRQRYAETIELMKAYIARRGAQARLAEAGLWIGKSCKAMGNRREALDVYLKTIMDFGNDPALDGVDQVQAQILTEFKTEPNPADLKYAIDRLNGDLALARRENERALALRLTALLIRLEKEPERGLRITDLLNATDMDQFSPLPMIALAENLAVRGDFANAERVAGEFNKRFPGSEQLLDMLNVEASVYLTAQDYAKTLSLTGEALSRFPADPRIGLSYKLRADALRLSGDRAAAIEVYQKIFSIRASHGSLAPEALYWIGICRQEMGQTEKAFAFFQRVYVLYKGYPEWVAKAYEASADCLDKLGRTDEMILTLKEMVATPAIQNTPEVKRAQEALRHLQTENAGG